jgi:hypothetical protein
MERLRGQRRGAKKIPPDHLYSSTLIRGIVKNQNPKRVCGRPVIIKNRANGEPVSFQCSSRRTAEDGMADHHCESQLAQPEAYYGEHCGRSSLQGGSDPDSARHSRNVMRLCGGDRRRFALWQRGNIGWQFGPFCLLAY